jgi:hypothetical protein
MIGNFPLWMIVVIWGLQRATAPRLTIYNYARWLRLIDDMRAFLPLPRGWLERRLVREMLVMLDQESAAIHQLIGMGAIGSGLLSKN